MAPAPPWRLPRPARLALLAAACLTLAFCTNGAVAQELPSTVFASQGPVLVLACPAYSLLLPLAAGTPGTDARKGGIFISGDNIYRFLTEPKKVRTGPTTRWASNCLGRLGAVYESGHGQQRGRACCWAAGTQLQVLHLASCTAERPVQRSWA